MPPHRISIHENVHINSPTDTRIHAILLVADSANSNTWGKKNKTKITGPCFFNKNTIFILPFYYGTLSPHAVFVVFFFPVLFVYLQNFLPSLPIFWTNLSKKKVLFPGMVEAGAFFSCTFLDTHRPK